MTPAAPVPRKTPLHAWHCTHGGRMAVCSGWEMPVEYGGAAAEHMAVRERAGLFDLSHLGEVELAGADALAALQRITCADAARLGVGEVQYSGLTTPAGTFVDDLLICRLGSQHFLLVVNAGNVGKDVAWVLEQARAFGDVAVVDTSSRYALLALQGPLARETLQAVTDVDLEAIEFHRFTHGEVAGARAMISRTGYTGECGYEVLTPPAAAAKVWEAVLREGSDSGVVPAGLGARDTLRLEAGIRLYGNDIDDTTSVLEADLEWIVGWEKGDFNGRAVLAEQKARGLSRRIVGFETVDGAVAERGHAAYLDGARVGTVTSGALAPFLQKAIGMTYLPVARTEPGTEFEVDVEGRRTKARVVPLPFYKRSKG